MDAAKGVTIVLVVLHHVCGRLTDAGIEIGWWRSVDSILTWVRMPVFFVLAGLFAAPVIHGEPIRLWRDRVAKFVYLFVLWSLLYLPFYMIEAALEGRSVLNEAKVRGAELAMAVSPIWFVLALAGFFAIARVARKLWMPAQIGMAGTLSIAVFVFGVRYPFEKIWLLIFFLAGCYFSASIRTAMKQVGANRLATASALRSVRWIGSHTLPVCLLHVPVLSVVLACGWFATTGTLAPVLDTAVTVTCALVAWLALRRIPGLFDLPPWTTAR